MTRTEVTLLVCAYGRCVAPGTHRLAPGEGHEGRLFCARHIPARPSGGILVQQSPLEAVERTAGGWQALVDRVVAVERERDELRAKVERIAQEHASIVDRQATALIAARTEVDRLRAVMLDVSFELRGCEEQAAHKLRKAATGA